MSDTKKIVLIIVIAVLLLAILIIAFAFSLQSSTSDVSGDLPGLLNPNAQETVYVSPPLVEDQDVEYSTRPELPETVSESLEEVIARYLAIGDFDGLDERLAFWSNTYKEDSDDALAEMDMIEVYRADIAYYKGLISDSSTVTTWNFRNSDMAAAAAIYAPISRKYQAIISRDSMILPPPEGSAGLKESENVDLRIKLNQINEVRSEDSQFQMIRAYDFTMLDTKCRVFVVSDIKTNVWQPYLLETEDGGNLGITVDTCYQLLATDSSISLDEVITF